VEGSGCVGGMAAQVGADVRKDFAGAKDGVGCSGMRDHFAFDSILLVCEREGGPRVAVHVDIIQRCVSGWDGCAVVELDGDVIEAEGL
jgi:hypothetical protein